MQVEPHGDPLLAAKGAGEERQCVVARARIGRQGLTHDGDVGEHVAVDIGERHLITLLELIELTAISRTLWRRTRTAAHLSH